MKIRALLVSDDVRDICDDNELAHPADVDAWVTAHEDHLTEVMEYAGKQEIQRLMEHSPLASAIPQTVWAVTIDARHAGLCCEAVCRTERAATKKLAAWCRQFWESEGLGNIYGAETAYEDDDEVIEKYFEHVDAENWSIDQIAFTDE